MNIDLHGKKALIGGSSAGLGLASAVELAKLGASCTLISRNELNLKKAIVQLDVSKGQRHYYIVSDHSQPDDIITKIANRCMEGEIWEILVLNTGGPPSGAILDLTTADFQQGFDAHFKVSHELVRLLVPGMKEKGYGRIISILSTTVRQPVPELPVSNVIRAALANWTKTLAEELGKYNITVNNVLPGYTETERLSYLFGKRAELSGSTEEEIRKVYQDSIPMRRMGKPEELGAVVAFLATESAGYINGINLPVDGGSLRTL